MAAPIKTINNRKPTSSPLVNLPYRVTNDPPKMTNLPYRVTNDPPKMTNLNSTSPPSMFQIAQAQAQAAAPTMKRGVSPTFVPSNPAPLVTSRPAGPSLPQRPAGPSLPLNVEGRLGKPRPAGPSLPLNVEGRAGAIGSTTPRVVVSSGGRPASPPVTIKQQVATTKQSPLQPLTSRPIAAPTKVLAPPRAAGLLGNAARAAAAAAAQAGQALAAAPATGAVPTMTPPVTSAEGGVGAPPPNVVQPQAAAPQVVPQAMAPGFQAYQPQVATDTGLGTEFNRVNAAEIARENQRGAAYDAAGRELAPVDKGDFTKPWDTTEGNFKAEYDKRYARMQDQWTQQKAALDAEMSGQQSRISSAAGNATTAINGATSQASVNAQNYGQPAASSGSPMDQSVLSGLGAAGAAQQASLGGPAAPTNMRSSAITPEIMAALNAQYQQTAGANASSASNAASSRGAANLQNAYEAQGKNENQLLDVFGSNTNNNTQGRTKSISDYYNANQGQVAERNKLLDKQYQESPANKTAMQEIASGGRNTADNVQREADSVRTAQTSRDNTADNITGRATTTGMTNATSIATGAARNATSIATTGMNNATSKENTAYRAANGPAAKPRRIKGDEYLSLRLPNSKEGGSADIVRQVSITAKARTKPVYLPGPDGKPMDGSTGKDGVKRPLQLNPFHNKPELATQSALDDYPTKLNKTALRQYLREYEHGYSYTAPAPKGSAAIGGGSSSAAISGGSGGGAVARALSQVGYTEGAGNSNQYSQRSAGVAGQAWCQDFVNDTLANSGVKLPPGAKVSGTRSAFDAWCKAGRQVDMAALQPGDVVYKTRGSDKTKGHVGIVVSIKNGLVTTVEGNSGPQSKAVAKQTSSLSRWNLGAVRP